MVIFMHCCFYIFRSWFECKPHIQIQTDKIIMKNILWIHSWLFSSVFTFPSHLSCLLSFTWKLFFFDILGAFQNVFLFKLRCRQTNYHNIENWCLNNEFTINYQNSFSFYFMALDYCLFTCLFPKFDIIDYKTNLGKQDLDTARCTIKQYLNKYQQSFVFLLFHHMLITDWFNWLFCNVIFLLYFKINFGDHRFRWKLINYQMIENDINTNYS